MGLAEAQFVPPPGGEPRLIDFNGRFYGSMALAIGAGVNLPAMWAALATGRAVERAAPAMVGVRYQWFLGDVRRTLSDGDGRRARGVIDCVRYARGAVQSVSLVSDPLPAVRHGWEAVRRSARSPPRSYAGSAAALSR